MKVGLACDMACAAALAQAAERYGIVDKASWQAVLQHDAAGFARSLCEALRAEPEQAAAACQWETQWEAVNEEEDVSTQTTEDMIELSTAEAMLTEAMKIGDENSAAGHAAELRARQFEDAAATAAALMQRADERTDGEMAARLAAEEQLAAQEQAARMAIEKLLAAEAAALDAASPTSAQRCPRLPPTLSNRRVDHVFDRQPRAATDAAAAEDAAAADHLGPAAVGNATVKR